MQEIIEEIQAERQRQEDKWGQQNHPILDTRLLNTDPDSMCRRYAIPTEEDAKSMVDGMSNVGGLTYMDILVEEVSEAAACMGDNTALRMELIQVAAVTVAMIESLDRNGV